MAVLVGKVFFCNKKNPPPELVEGSMYAKEVTTLREPQGPPFESLSEHCHPELDSGSVEVMAEWFTDAESSSA